MFATFEGLGGAAEDESSRSSASWSPTAKTATIVGAAVVGGILLIAGLAHANVCPRLLCLWKSNLKQYGPGMADMTRREAEARGCSWARGSLRDYVARSGRC